MKNIKLLVVLLLTFTSSITYAQEIVVTGISKYTLQLSDLISEDYQVTTIGYQSITPKSLEGKQVLALFNLRQTWSGTAWMGEQQVTAILEFVKNGGALYLTARKGYDNLLTPLGIKVEGNDGGANGRSWAVYNTQVTNFSSHPITEGINEIDIDVNALFEADNNWQIIGKTKEDQKLLAVRTYGKGKVVLGCGIRNHRDPSQTTNRYESDIRQKDNYQYFVNVFQFLTQMECEDPFTKGEDSDEPEMKFNIYPNPTTNRITVAGENIQLIQLYNIKGQLLKQLNITNPEKTEIDLGTFAKGLYYLKIKTQTKTYTQEVVLIE